MCQRSRAGAPYLRGRAAVPRGMLTHPRQGEAHRDRCSPVEAAGLHTAVLMSDRPTREDCTAGWPKKETS